MVGDPRRCYKTVVSPTGEDGMSGRDATKEGRSRSATRLLPLLALLVGLGLFLALGLQDQLNCAALRDNRAWLGDWVASHRLLAILGFMALYAAAVALSVPGAAILSVAAGFLFGTPTAAAMVVTAATAGATVLFWPHAPPSATCCSRASDPGWPSFSAALPKTS